MRDLPQVRRLTCPNCHRRYQSGQVAILGYHGDDYLIRCSCVCGLIATFLVTATSDDPKGPPITIDDVLAAHEFLKCYAGNVYGLIGLPKEEPKQLPPPKEPKDGEQW